jgi:hypothetical protein
MERTGRQQYASETHLAYYEPLHPNSGKEYQ